MKLNFIYLFTFIFLGNIGFSQIIQITPAFPTVNDVITVEYDATQGNGGLVGVSPIYTHTGVVTQIGLPSSWSYTQGSWGQADTNVLMTDLGNNIHELIIDIDQYYGFPTGTNVAKLAFVFRNFNGSLEGKTATMGDIFYPIYPVNGGFQAAIIKPYSDQLVNLYDTITFNGQANSLATLELYDNGILIADTVNSNSLDKSISINNPGDHELIFVANDGNTTIYDTINYVVIPSLNFSNPPSNLVDGINYIDDSTVTLKFFAPEKNTVNLIGDHNNWMVNSNSFMNLSTDSLYWWKTISNLTPGQKYTYQYLVDGNIKIADPLSPLILDPNNDGNIGSLNYPNPIPYPSSKTNGFVTVMEPGKTPYNWVNSNFSPPAKKDLIIYELLVRDFVASHSYKTLIDTLDYLSNLGINAIELMPPGEFENNESWGYNPSFHMALDKYYGTPEHFKTFVDSCHGRGIAVINDIVFNQAFGQSPMVNLYWDGINSRPAANNPWFNEVCPHPPYCWGYDFDHSSQATRNFIDRVNHFWLDEYHIDGFRFDFTKGFSNNSNNYDDDRIDLLKRMADTIWSVHPNSYVILEHWAANNEEKNLANYGMMLWGNVTHGYQESAMGFPANSNLVGGVYKYRLWNDPHLISYMESHDEERIMYKNITYGNTNGSQNAKNPIKALERTEGLAVLMLTTPGPKMIWQFGEMGYDISIDYPCRICNKPILWNYLSENSRKRLYDVYKATINLRKSHPVFTGDDFTYSLNGAVKTLTLNNPNMNALVAVNIDVNSQDKILYFQNNGWWYEYFTGDSLEITGNTNITLNPGEYRIYTNVKLDQPVIQNTVDIEEFKMAEWEVNIYPNPSCHFIKVSHNSKSNKPLSYAIVNTKGEIVLSEKPLVNENHINIENLKKGNYFLIIRQNNQIVTEEFMKI
ncbi:alpha-amylase family glycosyl hydrolase [Flavobacteriales bacterium]|nr:alpha-amylase family glycosyl hydrolase [Flavobacteriales bacterium]